MWDGPRQGPRGGPPFRGDSRGEMFGGRDGPMPDFRARDGMNMGPMGSMGPRPQDRPPMDMRMLDGPPNMRGHDMDLHDIRGRDPPRDMRPGEDTDFSLRRHYEMSIRDKLMNAASGFMGQGRHNVDMRGRGGMQPRDHREPNDRFMGMRDRDMYRGDMPGFNNPNMDSRRGFPMDPMGRNEGFRDMRDRPPMGVEDIDGFNMDIPPRERGMMDVDRRGAPPPSNPRGRFESDMDFRKHPSEFRGRDRSPVRFGDSDGAPMDARGRPNNPPDVSGGGKPKASATEDDTVRDREFPDDLPVDFRGDDEVSLAEEWRNRSKKERESFLPPVGRGIPPFPRDVGLPGQRLPPGIGREGGLAEGNRDRPPAEFPGKEGGPFGFPRRDREPPGAPNWDKNGPNVPFVGMNLPQMGRKGPQDPPFPAINPLLNPQNRENDGKRWDRDPKQNPNPPILGDRPAYLLEKTPPPLAGQGLLDLPRFKVPKDVTAAQGPEPAKLGAGTGPDFQSNSREQQRDQDYRDIDYRTNSARVFDYKHEDLPGPEKGLKETKQIPTSKFTDSGSQDQDYRSATVKDKVTHTICITGIPKTATMEQILGAFAVRDGVPMQGMKIKNVVPGYSFDTAYVEFLNLEDAVHFMESNQGSLKVGTKTALMRYVQPDRSAKEAQEPGHKGPPPPSQEPLLPSPDELLVKEKGSGAQQQDEPQNKDPAGPVDPLAQGPAWQRSSDLTPEAWQQQVDQQLRQQEAEQQAESWASRNPQRHGPHQTDPIFKESKTMIIKNVKPTTTVEIILKALDPFAYLDERNVRLVRGKPPGAKCFCFVDMDSHEQVTRLVELLTKPRPLSIDGVRVYAEVAKPLKNQKREFDKSNTSLLGYPPEANMLEQQQYYPQPPPVGAPGAMPGDLIAGSTDPQTLNPTLTQGGGYSETPPVDPSFQALGPQVSAAAAGLATPAAPGDGSEAYSYASETPDMTNYLYDATSGFYYDPQTTLYYDPGSRYFYNAETQQYLYWDEASKTYIPVPGHSAEPQAPVAQPALTLAPDVQAILANPAADAPLDMKKPSDPPPPPTPNLAYNTPPEPPSPSNPPTSPNASLEPREEDDGVALMDKKDKDKDKEDKPRSLAAFKIMKDMERWAKIQNRQKESVRAPSPVLKAPGGGDDRKTSKAADAAFAIFERKGSAGDDLFKKPMLPVKKEKGSKSAMGSLGLLASDYAATGSDEEEEERHEPLGAPRTPAEEKEDKLTDWKKMACLLCRRQFPNKDALVRHQQLSDLHKQNMEIHLKIKRSKKELEALENQEKEQSAKESNGSPEVKKRKQHHHQQQHHQHHHQQHQNSWAGGSRDMHKGSDRPGLGSEPVERKKKEPVVWNSATYKQAVRKAMFARFKELD